MAGYRLWLRGGASLEIDAESRDHVISYMGQHEQDPNLHDYTTMQLTDPQGRQMDVRIQAIDAITVNTAP